MLNHFVILNILSSVTTEENVRRVFKAMKVDLSEIRRQLKKASPLMSSKTYAIRCEKCKSWNFSFHVFCPYCTNSLKSLSDDRKECRLVSCRIDTCPGHMAYNFENLKDIQMACCRHTSRQPKGQNIPLNTIESIIASVVASGLYTNCVLLSEDDLLEELRRAEFWGYYSSLFSKNAATIYGELGYTRVSAEIKKWHSRTTQPSIQLLQQQQDQLREDTQYLSKHKQGKDSSGIVI